MATTAATTELKYRIAKGHDWGKLEKLFETLGWPMPNRSRSQIILAEDANGEICAVTVLEARVHAEPNWVREDQRGRVSHRRMQRMAEDFLGRLPGSSYWMFTIDAHQEKFMKALGFEEKPWKVWQKTFK